MQSFTPRNSFLAQNGTMRKWTSAVRRHVRWEPWPCPWNNLAPLHHVSNYWQTLKWCAEDGKKSARCQWNHGWPVPWKSNVYIGFKRISQKFDCLGKTPRRETSHVEAETPVGKSKTIGWPNFAEHSAKRPKRHFWGPISTTRRA
jgi:hypothetical protein